MAQAAKVQYRLQKNAVVQNTPKHIYICLAALINNQINIAI